MYYVMQMLKGALPAVLIKVGMDEGLLVFHNFNTSKEVVFVNITKTLLENSLRF